MFITQEILEKKGARNKIIQWLVQEFPQGGELLDILKYPVTDYEILHWLYSNIEMDNKEFEAYWKSIEVDTPTLYSIYKSDHIVNSSYISLSSRVKNSNYIFFSKDVDESNSVLSSNYVMRSKQIINSEFCYDSNKVFQSRNVNDSHNIICSDYVVNSDCVLNSNSVVDSFCVGNWLGETSRITASCFVSNCQDLDHCLFCYQKNNSNYLLFNEPIAPNQFELIKKQMSSLLDNWEPAYTLEEWPAELIPMEGPRLQRNPIKLYANLPEPFWRWVKTLPGYNPSILYSITFQAKMIS